MAEQQVCEPVLLNTFLVRKKRCKVYFHRGTLTWETEVSPYTRCAVSMRDVISVGECSYICHDEDDCWTDDSRGYTALGGRSSKEMEVAAAVAERTRRKRLRFRSGQPGFVIHYAARAGKNKWRHESVTLRHTDPQQVASWLKTLRNYLS
ncbi:hypothetical protein J437_LFUL014157, partial [Ladona fulva]